MRYFLDSISTPDRCTDPNLAPLGMQLTGYELPPPTDPSSPTIPRSGSASKAGINAASSFRNSTPSTVTASPVGGNALSSSQTSSKNPITQWLPEFYADLTTCVWITYCSRFHPIRGCMCLCKHPTRVRIWWCIAWQSGGGDQRKGLPRTPIRTLE